MLGKGWEKAGTKAWKKPEKTTKEPDKSKKAPRQHKSKHMFVKCDGRLYNASMRKYQSDINRILSLIYDDQPIAPPQRASFQKVPERIRAVRSLGKGAGSYRQPREVIFVHQARMMADYEDDYEYSREVRIWYPTYESLTDEQLRGYFGFRSRVRKGIIKRESDCYAFLYIFELLNLIGCKNAEEAFEKLSSFLDLYGKLSPGILPYGEQWLIDFVLYYALDPKLLDGRKPILYDKAMSVLLQEEKIVIEQMDKNGAPGKTKSSGKKDKEEIPGSSRGLKKSLRNQSVNAKAEVYPETEEQKEHNQQIFEATLLISGMQEDHLEALGKKNTKTRDTSDSQKLGADKSAGQTSSDDPADEKMLFQAVLAATFKGMCSYYKSHRNTSLMDDYTGFEIQNPVQLFSGAVFHDDGPAKGSGTFSENEKEYSGVELSPVTFYWRESGKWIVSTRRRNYQNPHFGELLRTVDCLIRESNGETEVVPSGLKTKWVRKLISEKISVYKKEEKDAQARRIEIDLNMLAGIRSAAKQTMEKLMTEDELDAPNDLRCEWNESADTQHESVQNDSEQVCYGAAKKQSEYMDSKEKAETRVGADWDEGQKGKDNREKLESNLSEGDAEIVQRVTEETGLSETEILFLRWIIDPKKNSRPKTEGQIVSVIVDSINEKLYDMFADLVIELDAEPEVIEEYRDDLLKLVF
ncbi:MAG: TerB N-terminal domain-containing protein [Parasporobacterium sp.]|nr:TerB N-terminal domain-containing protein [Parasporobacterium sp.]